MEKFKKQTLLLVAFILGVCVLILWGLNIPNQLIVTNEDYERFFEDIPLGIQLPNGMDKEELKKFISKEQFQKTHIEGLLKSGEFWFAVALFIIHIPAVLLNFFSWRKNAAKKTLIAAILYLVSLNIPSAVLCFISFGKLKKLNIAYGTSQGSKENDK